MYMKTASALAMVASSHCVSVCVRGLASSRSGTVLPWPAATGVLGPHREVDPGVRRAHRRLRRPPCPLRGADTHRWRPASGSLGRQLVAVDVRLPALETEALVEAVGGLP